MVDGISAENHVHVLSVENIVLMRMLLHSWMGNIIGLVEVQACDDLLVLFGCSHMTVYKSTETEMLPSKECIYLPFFLFYLTTFTHIPRQSPSHVTDPPTAVWPPNDRLPFFSDVLGPAPSAIQSDGRAARRRCAHVSCTVPPPRKSPMGVR